jgi:ectoine hydroxylase-related dioxygenase (phytanoyl-CoA dioxygenase family)
VIPGSQRWGLLAGALRPDLNIRTFEDVERRGKAIPVPMKRGDVLLFGNLTFHASKLNRTQGVRCVIASHLVQEHSRRRNWPGKSTS